MKSTNVTVSGVRTELGETTNNVGKLCTSSKINKWSRWKPVQFDKSEPITQIDLQLINYGYSNLEYNNPHKAFAAIENDEIWKYDKPTSYFRLGDFRNYNPAAERPYQGEITGGTTAYAGESIHFNLSNNILDLMNWQILNNDKSLNVGVIMRNVDKVYFYNCGNILDMDNEKMVLTIPPDLPIGGYQIVPVVTNNSTTPILSALSISPLDTAYRWIIFPTIPLYITVTDVPQFNPFNYVTITAEEDGAFAYGEDNVGEYVKNITLMYRWTIKPEYNGNPFESFNMKLSVLNTIVGTSPGNTEIYTADYQNVPAGDSMKEEVVYTNKIYLVGPPKDGTINMDLDATITVDGVTKTKTYHFTAQQTNMLADIPQTMSLLDDGDTVDNRIFKATIKIILL